MKIQVTWNKSERTGISVGDLLSNAARQWYIIQFDVPASFIRLEIKRGKQKIARERTAYEERGGASASSFCFRSILVETLDCPGSSYSKGG